MMDSLDLAQGSLPPVETTAILLMRFTAESNKNLRRLVKRRLRKGGIIILSKEFDDDGREVLLLTTTQHELEMEAEQLGLMKSVSVKGGPKSLNDLIGYVILEPFCMEEEEDFKTPMTGDRGIEDSTRFSVFDSDGLFTSSERVRLCLAIVESLSVLCHGETTSDLANELHDIRAGTTGSSSSSVMKLMASSRLLNSNPTYEEYQSMYLCEFLINNNLIDIPTPVHIKHLKDKIYKDTFFQKRIPLQAWRDYYGEEIAYYFAWMEFYGNALFFPGLSGLAIWIVRTHRGDSIDTCTLTPFHGLITFFWAIMFLKYWTREENRLAYSWGTFTSHEGYTKPSTVRPEFRGEMKRSRVTGKMAKYFSRRKRLMRYAGSAVVTIILLAAAFFVMILSLNMQGLIHHIQSKNDEEDRHHPFHYPFFASFADEGNIFDSTSSWKCYLPTILHVILVLNMNANYRHVAERLTDWENHEKDEAYDNSLVLKRFLFEAFDSYFVLFYLAFYEQDIAKLRSELVSLFNIDTFRRLFMEGAMPYLVQKFGSKKKQKAMVDKKKTDETSSQQISPIVEELNKDKYEQFDDYIEMVLQLGYVTLFASAYPFAAFVAIAANAIEYRLDAFKLTSTCCRPQSVPRSNIGIWKNLMKSIVWLSAITNCLLFGLSSDQMYQYFPDYFTESSEHDIKDGDGSTVVFIIFGIERIVLLVGLFFTFVIPDIPGCVLIKEQRKEYVYFEQHQFIRSKIQYNVREAAKETLGDVSEHSRYEEDKQISNDELTQIYKNQMPPMRNRRSFYSTK